MKSRRVLARTQSANARGGILAWATIPFDGSVSDRRPGTAVIFYFCLQSTVSRCWPKPHQLQYICHACCVLREFQPKLRLSKRVQNFKYKLVHCFFFAKLATGTCAPGSFRVRA